MSLQIYLVSILVIHAGTFSSPLNQVIRKEVLQVILLQEIKELFLPIHRKKTKYIFYIFTKIKQESLLKIRKISQNA